MDDLALANLQISALQETLELEQKHRVKTEQQMVRMEREVEDLTQLLFTEASDRVRAALIQLDKEVQNRQILEQRCQKLSQRLHEERQITELHEMQMRQLKLMIQEFLVQKSFKLDRKPIPVKKDLNLSFIRNIQVARYFKQGQRVKFEQFEQDECVCQVCLVRDRVSYIMSFPKSKLPYGVCTACRDCVISEDLQESQK